MRPTLLALVSLGVLVVSAVQAASTATCLQHVGHRQQKLDGRHARAAERASSRCAGPNAGCVFGCLESSHRCEEAIRASFVTPCQQGDDPGSCLAQRLDAIAGCTSDPDRAACELQAATDSVVCAETCVIAQAPAIARCEQTASDCTGACSRPR